MVVQVISNNNISKKHFTFNMKKIIFTVIILFLFQTVRPQLCDKIHYIEDNELSNEVVYDIEVAFEDFMQTGAGGQNEKFFLIEIVERDNFNELYLFSTRYIFEIMFKRPDCYFKCNDTIITYLYTKDHIHVSDSTWLNNIMKETSIVLGAPDFNVVWSNDSVIGPIWGTGDMNRTDAMFFYDPVPFKYIVKNGDICSKEVVYKLYYPDDRRPKGIPIMRSLPYWPVERESYYRGS
jgi:hypothetical protein